jgi:hypothetical protein
MTTPPIKINFQSLLRDIDKDYDNIGKSDNKRNLIYYTVKIDGRTTDIYARRNNRRVTFLIRSLQDEHTYTMLYLSEIDLITILATLEDELYKHIMDRFIKACREKNDPDEHIVEFARETMSSGLTAISATANDGLVIIAKHDDNPNIATRFGFDISYQSFCDDLSLIFSTENSEKLKLITVKYYVFSNIIRASHKGMPLPKELAHISTLEDIERIYKDMRPKQILAYDHKVFKYDEYAEYFQSVL